MSAKEVLQKMAAVYEKSSNYEVKQRYELFKGEKGSKVEYSYDGIFRKNKGNVYQKIDQTEFIVTNDFCLKISHSENIVELSKGDVYNNKDFDFEKTLKECKEVKLEETEKNYYLTLHLKQSSQVPYTRIELKINKSNFHLIQLDLYYWHQEDFSEDVKKKDMHTPHMRVYYLEFNRNKIPSEIFEFTHYFEKKGHFIKLKGELEKYELIDQRNKF